ncbi:hypothetical protein V8E55_008817 [Tylopilus felleus]
MSSKAVLDNIGCSWIMDANHGNAHFRVQAHYQRNMVILMFAQASVFCASSAILSLSDTPETLSSLLPASRVVSLAGILTQIASHRGIPSLTPDPTSSSSTPEGTKYRNFVFAASLWVPFLPFVLSIILLCFGLRDGRVLPVVFPTFLIWWAR